MKYNLTKENFFSFIKKKATKDYTYTTFFFLIFSFFIIFVIRPNIKSIFEANLEIEKLKKENTIYEYEINNILDVQEKLITIRDDISLLDDAVTDRPQVNRMIDDIVKAAEENNITIDEFNLVDVNLKDIAKSQELKNLVFDLAIRSNFENYLSFIENLYRQRRIKSINKMTISKEKINLHEASDSANISSNSANLSIQLLVEGYYL